MTLYALKPRFQALLRPVVGRLASLGVTANVVTVAAAAGSMLIGSIAAWYSNRRVFLVLPIWLVLRMALNAVDGMLAREFGQKSVLGGYLNEVGDVVSDAALYAPFARIAPFNEAHIAPVIVLAIIAEIAGALGPMMGVSRRYDGPMGKSDRALLFGLLAVYVGASTDLPLWVWWAAPALDILLAMTIVNRIRSGVREAQHATR